MTWRAITGILLFYPVLAGIGIPAVAGDSVPIAVAVARATAIPDCTSFVDAASPGGEGSAEKPFETIAAAVAAAKPGAVICVAEGTYAEELLPGAKYFTLAGGFRHGTDFKLRDSASYVSKAVGKGGSFIRIVDPGPRDGQLTAIDGFDISGYGQAIYRDYYESQLFDITNNVIHDNLCPDPALVGAGFALNNVSGVIRGNVFARNSCGRGGAGFLNDSSNRNRVAIENNRIEGNAGTEPGASHGGALYLFGNTLTITANEFIGNSVTQWGGGLYVGAYTEGGQPTSATLAWNVYRGNRAGNGGGGFFCDDGAKCTSAHEIYDSNCGGNILLDSGSDGSSPTVAAFDHMTNFGALDGDCAGPGPGVRIDKDSAVADSYSFTNTIFWGNAESRDFAVTCARGCDTIEISVAYSMVQTEHLSDGAAATFGAGIVAPSDPLFAAPDEGDFHLRSAAGRWTASGHVNDSGTSPAIGKADPQGAQDQNLRGELGAYGNSGEASLGP